MQKTMTIPVTASGSTVNVTVERKHVKNFNLRITSAGELRASAPLGASQEQVESFISRNTDWIARRLAAFHERRAETVSARENLAPSSIIPLWGKPVTVKDALLGNFEPPRPRAPQATFASYLGRESTEANHSRPASNAVAVLNNPTAENLAQCIQTLYRREVEAALPDLVRKYEVAMGVQAARVSVRSMKTRWGSCTPKTGAVRMALELAAYPPACLDMVVAHELVHLLEPSHSERFHALLDRYCPKNKILSARLRKPPLTPKST